MGKYVLGVDGGSTKSHLAVFGRDGKCAGVTVYGSLNHEGMEGSYAELDEHLGELIPRTLSCAGAAADDVAFAVLGLSGADTKAQIATITGMVKKTGIENVVVCNDAVLGVPAGCPDGIGICAINGTGFKLAAIDRNDVILDTCGLGSFTDDRGGGSWYGGRACGEVYNALYKLGRPTMMREMLFDYLGIKNKSEYLDVITEMLYGDSGKLFSVEMNSIPFKAAAQGDAVALDILDESAAEYGGAIARLAMDLYFPCDEVLHVTLAGSVFVKQAGSALHEKVKEHVAQLLGERKVDYRCIDTHPVTGAVVLAAYRAGFEFDLEAVKAEIKAAKL